MKAANYIPHTWTLPWDGYIAHTHPRYIS